MTREWLSTPAARDLLVAVALGLGILLAYLAVMPEARLAHHSPYNHFALQAEAWLSGRLDLGGPPPRYTGFDDFVVYADRYFVSFPPVPSALVLPFVAAAGTPEAFRGPLLFACLAPLGPALFFLALQKLRRLGRAPARSRRDAIALAALLGLGTVYWFSAVQGSVWFAAHVVTMVFACGFILASLEAEHPLAAGLCLALAMGTRPTLAFASPLFVHEAFRQARGVPRAPRGRWAGACRERLLKTLGLFAIPMVVVGALLAAHNFARFGDPLEFGHRLLAVRWRARIDQHGLFDLSYLDRNLVLLLGGVPFYRPGVGWQINAHGLALWLTTPVYLWALLPRRPPGPETASSASARSESHASSEASTSPLADHLRGAAAVSALAVALPSLLYQNSGWLQFGQRFSNDYAPLLLLIVALGGRRFGRLFWVAATVAVAVNAVGALTFQTPAGEGLYFVDPSQRILIWPGGPTHG